MSLDAVIAIGAVIAFGCVALGLELGSAERSYRRAQRRQRQELRKALGRSRR